MTKPIVFMFSGQGSHYYHMGEELYAESTVFKQWMQTGDSIYKNIVGFSLLEKLYDPNRKKMDAFNETLLTHPAIFIVQHALGQMLLAQGVQPDYALGTSLGEFAAAVFTGVLSFEVALTCVITQAQLLTKHCDAGSMIAVLASSEIYRTSDFLREKCELASINFTEHFVLTCAKEDLLAVETYLNNMNINSQRLAVDHGFHSKLIDAAAYDYQVFMQQQVVHPASLFFISCARGGYLETIASQHFWDCIRQPIQFQKTLLALEQVNSYRYIDVGPSGTLATFAKYNLPPHSGSEIAALLTPFGYNKNAVDHVS